MSVNISILVCILYAALTVAAFPEEGMSKEQFEGPLRFYQELGCSPVYADSSEKYVYKYDCNRLENHSPNKCYLNGYEYDIGEAPRSEDVELCDHCRCRQEDGFAKFLCAIPNCYLLPLQPGCYAQHNATTCCPGTVTCLDNPEDRPTCEVDGKIYKDGEYFEPSTEPNKRCFCGPDYTGQNVEPFCKLKAPSECKTELYYYDKVVKKCAPIYDFNRSPTTDCPFIYRCQKLTDEVIKKSNQTSEGSTCKFGNLTMQVGDKLNRNVDDYYPKCAECVCEVPPVPTCRRLPDEICTQSK